MKIRCLRDDGVVVTVPCVKWHPAYSQSLGLLGKSDYPSGLWVCEEHVKRSDLASITSAEAPFEIYSSCDDKMSWRHNGLLVKSVPYLDDPEFWENHA